MTTRPSLRQRLAALARTAIDSATDPKSPDFLNFSKGRQPLVDAAFLADAGPNLVHDLFDIDRVGANVEVRHGSSTGSGGSGSVGVSEGSSHRARRRRVFTAGEPPWMGCPEPAWRSPSARMTRWSADTPS